MIFGTRVKRKYLLAIQTKVVLKINPNISNIRQKSIDKKYKLEKITPFISLILSTNPRLTTAKWDFLR